MAHTTLYDPNYEHGSCGLGFVARVDGRPSHGIVQAALTLLGNLAHRGASGSDGDTGDGAGLLLQVPDTLLRREAKALGIALPPPGAYGVGVLFLSPDLGVRGACERALERIAAEEGQPVLGWRDVPVNPGAIGQAARDTMPVVRQVILARSTARGRRGDDAFERKLYVIRRRLHRLAEDRLGGADACYVASMSGRTVVYKGLLRGPQVRAFYPDLTDPGVESALALVHSRFSTNTLGSWQLAHPYRYVAHNGEINALWGNVNWMRAREARLASPLFGPDMDRVRPLLEPRVSDSAAFDNVLELLVLSGRSLPHSMMMMVPEAWENVSGLDPDLRGFYRYHSAVMEPWDGPAAIAFCDGRIVGARLDRNGLRPARYAATRDGLVVLASEEGALPLDPADVVIRSRLRPGSMIVVDTEQGCLLDDHQIVREVASRRPYRRWADEGTVALGDLPALTSTHQPERAPLQQRQIAQGYTFEDLTHILMPMAAHAREPDSSMGTDTPLAVLSQRPQPLFAYFKQLFAQVTNPPIDPLREETVMSLQMSLGPEANLLDEGPHHCRRIVLDGPVLTPAELERLRPLRRPFVAQTLSLLFPVSQREQGMEAALDALCRQARQAVASGTSILILSDRGIDAEHAAIPSLLATAAVHHDLVRAGTRTSTGLVVETAEAREVHHIALLVGYGATAVCPYLAFETVAGLAGSGALAGLSGEEATGNMVKAIERGLRKIISKMGISTLPSYCGAQLFEAVGLAADLVEAHFPGTASRVGGLGIWGVARETLARHAAAFGPDARTALETGGEHLFRVQGEHHQWNPASIVALQRAAQTGSFASYEAFAAHVDGGPPATLRALLDFAPDPVPLPEVEPAADIVKRFSTGAMSFGSLSREAHETLAVAMNRIGGKSNTGEGGEEVERFLPDLTGDLRRSAIKQVASGRFGVTAEYLVHADVLQIKMAQGSKPGEGGQLPGHKVTEDIARVRRATPGVGLISPPPHHDIYSIEDLAQLISDLKHINPKAQVSVKLVSEVGVGTIAAGVVKARADHLTISGHDGGTGASPLSSIKHAGLPWELGLAETQQVLVQNCLRGRVRVQVDGHLKTGRDVAIAALLGADEFAFSTAPLVATGCIMMRACHLNACPVGIATQDPELRTKFAGKPEHVINYLFFVAEDLRRIMAHLGFRRLDDMIGRCGRLRVRIPKGHPKAATLDLSRLLAPPAPGPRRHVADQEHSLTDTLDYSLARACGSAVERGERVAMGSPGDPLPIRNVDRSVGAALSGQIARIHGDAGLPPDTVSLTFRGSAGQSFGAWGARGLLLVLQGEANDYLGKGLSGAVIAVTPPPGATVPPERAVAVGNVALYGATAGEAYIRGLAGERFAVRNSGALAVVEGIGDHGCEYMTGGVAVVLGGTGRNFAAGMSGGVAFVLDLWGRFAEGGLCNPDMVGLGPVQFREDVALLHDLIRRHLEWTGSPLAARVLANWNDYLPRFVKVLPNDMERVLAARRAEQGARALEQAV